MNIELHNLTSDGIAYCEAIGLSKIFAAYAQNAGRETIESIGFNPNSGYVYIALENGIQICSMLGQSVEYIVSYDGNELFYDSYEDAISHSWDDDTDYDPDYYADDVDY